MKRYLSTRIRRVLVTLRVHRFLPHTDWTCDCWQLMETDWMDRRRQ